MAKSPRSRWMPRVRLLLALVALALLGLWPALVRAMPLTDTQRLDAVWATAQEVGRYRYQSRVTQTTHPTERLTNVGRTSRMTSLHAAGELDRHAGSLRLLLNGEGRGQGIEIEVADGQARGRTVGTTEWEVLDNPPDLFSGGEALGFLVAAKNVKREAASVPDGLDGLLLAQAATRYTFELDGSAYARHARAELEAMLRARGELPAGITLGLAHQYVEMTGQGELWVDQEGLPIRQTVRLTLPPETSDLEWVEAEIVTDFSHWDAPVALSLRQMAQEPQALAARLLASRPVQAGSQGLALLLVVLVGTFVLVQKRHARPLYAAVAGAVVLSLVGGPLLQTQQLYAFSVNQAEQLEKQEEQQTAQAEMADLKESSFDPHAAPLPAAPPALSAQQSALLNVVSSADTDGDGLTNGVELSQLNTAYDDSDTDDDGLKDKAELVGFTYNNKTWYLNPRSVDSNGDGLTDGIECPALETATTTPKCPDSDNDKTPDIFDFDDDADGVPDSVDNAPSYRGALTTASQSQVSYNLSGYTTGRTLFVDFTLRPTDASHLGYANNVLNWPSEDTQGQIQRKSDNTFADLGETGSKLDNGDILLVPMLELSIPYNAANPSAGLPIKAGQTVTTTFGALRWLDTDALKSYSISVNVSEDGQELTVYVPLTTETDPAGDIPVAFSGRMAYLPSVAAWGSNHEARLLWVVTALVDSCDSTTLDCSVASNWISEESIIQTYYDPFSLTGLSVKEDQGMEVALLAQRNATSAAAGYEDGLWHVADGLQSVFLRGRKLANNSRFGVDEIHRRWKSATTASSAERWGVAAGTLDTMLFSATNGNGFATQTAGWTSLTNTHLPAFLAQSQPSAASGASATVLIASEELYRVTALGESSTTSYANNVLSVNLASMTTTRTATVSWAPYTKDAAGWAAQDVTTYLDKLETGLIPVFSAAELTTLVQTQFGETLGDQALSRAGAVALAKSYYLSVNQGSTQVVGVGSAVISDGTLTDSTYTLGTLKPVTRILVDILGAMQSYFLNTSSITLDGTEIASSLTGSLSSVSILVEEAGKAQAEMDDDGTFGTNWTGGLSLSESAFKKLVKSSKGLPSGSEFVFRELTSKAKSFAMGAVVGGAVLMFGASQMGASEAEWLKYAANLITISSESLYLVASVSTLILYRQVSHLPGALKAIEKNLKLSAIVGLVGQAVLTTGLLLYTMMSQDIATTDLAFTQLLAQTMASILVAILYTVLSLSAIGAVAVSLLGLVDAIMALVCTAVGIDEVSELGQWLCGGITGALVKLSTYLLFDQTPLIDLQPTDRLSVQLYSPTLNTTTGNPAGYVAGNTLTLSGTITSTLYMNSPDGAGGLVGASLMTDGALDNTRMGYTLSGTEGGFAPGAVSWLPHPNRTNKRRFYQTFSAMGSVALPAAGINQALPTYLNESIQADALECWVVVTCVIRSGDYQEVNPIDLSNTFVFDVLPATFSEFVALTSDDGISYRLAWDDRFQAEADADGDGLISQAQGGPDPNDSLYDTDGDKLSDYWELYSGFDPTVANSDQDGDGLADYWEALHGTDAWLPDSDGDGLTDGAEIFHPTAYHPYDNTPILQGVWTGGWSVVYDYSGSTALSTWVSGDPTTNDGDGDGLSDYQESIYHYHPDVVETDNLLSMASGLQMAGGEYLSEVPGYNTMVYTATVTNEMDATYANGLLQVEFPIDSNPPQVEEPLEGIPPLSSLEVEGNITLDPTLFSESTVTSMTVRTGALLESYDTGRVLWLRMNETSGTTYTDSSNRSHHASCISITCPTIDSTGIHFSEYARVSPGGHADFNLASFTVAMWIRPTISSGNSQVLISSYSASDSNSLTWRLLIEGSGDKVFFNTGALNGLTSASDLQLGRWNHVAVTYDATTRATKIYFNGVLNQSGTTGPVPTGRPNLIQLGNGFVGYMKDVELYHSALTAAQISALHETVMSLEEWTPNISMNGYHIYQDDLAYSSVDVWCTTVLEGIYCPSQVTGYQGKGFHFDQSGARAQFLTLQNDPNLDLVQGDNTFSVAMWINPENSYSPDNAHLTSQGQLLIGNTDDGYAKAPPSVYIRGNQIVVRYGLSGGTTWCEAATTNNPIGFNSWQHLALTFDNTSVNGFLLYRNGSLYSARANWTYTISSGGDATPCLTGTLYSVVAAGGSPTLFLGHGRTPAVFIDRLYMSEYAPNTGEGQPHEGYFWTRTGTSRELASVSGLSEGVTDEVDVWAQSPGEDAFEFYLCNDDGSHTDCRDNTGNYDNYLVRPLNQCTSPSNTGCWGTTLFHLYYETLRTITIHYDHYRGNFSRNRKWGGYLYYSLYNDGFEGTMDEIGLYRTALSATEVATVYQQALHELELPFDEATGQDLFSDRSGNEATVSCPSATACPDSGLPGQENFALRFDGVDDYLNTNQSSAELARDDFTIAAWVKTTGVNIPIVTKSNSNTLWEGGEKSFYLNGGGQPTFVGHSNDYIRSTQAVNDGQWHHVAVVWDYSGSGSSGTGRIYVDGVDRTGSNGYAANYADNSGDTLKIGRPNFGEAPSSFVGSLDHFVVERQALSQEAVVALMNEAPRFNLHLDEDLADLTFDDEGPSAQDVRCDSFSSNEATDTCPAAGVDGHIREAVNFDGNDRLYATTSNLNLPTWTMAMWVKPFDTRTSTLLRKGSISGSSNTFLMWTTSSGHVKAEFHMDDCNTGVPFHIQSTFPLPENQWTHLAATLNGSKLTLYINGQPNVSTDLPGLSACTAGSDLYLGESYVGLMDEVTVHAVARSAADILSLFQTQAAWHDVAFEHPIKVDLDAPTVALQRNGETLRAVSSGPLYIAASDPTSSVVRVQVRVNGGAWQEATPDGETWLFTFGPAAEGNHTITLLATDQAGNSSAQVNQVLAVDNSAPALSLDMPEAVAPADNTLPLSGSLSDTRSGVTTNTTTIELFDYTGTSVSQGQSATVSEATDALAGSTTWDVAYPVPLEVPYGAYEIQGRTEDQVGNLFTTTLGSVAVDGLGPVASLATQATMMTQTGTVLGGVVSDLPLASESVLRLHFEEQGVGTVALFADSSRNQHAATCSGTACPTAGGSGVHGRALTFDGTNDTLRVPNSLNAFDLTNATLMAWIKPTWATSAPGYNPAILAVRDGSGTRYSWHINRNYQTMELWNGSSVGQLTVNLTRNQWVHVALVMQDGKWTGYLNGVAVGTITQSFSSQVGKPLNIGSSTGSQEFFIGQMDEVMLYDRALSADTMYRIANPLVDMDRDDSALQFSLPLNEAAGATIFEDASPNNADATCSGTCPTAGASGYGSAGLAFSGSQYVTIARAMNLTQFSHGAWIYPTHTDQGFRGIMGSTTSNLGRERGPTLYAHQGTKIHGGFGDGTNWYAYTTPNSVLTLNAWNHVAATFDGTTYTLYVNGKQVYSTASFAGRVPIPMTAYILGRTDHHFQGRMDSAFMYSRALTPPEIYSLAYGAGSTITEVQLRFRHAQDGEQGADDGLWVPAALAAPDATQTTWSYPLNAALEGPYKIDLKATDSLGNTRYLPNAWTGVIDTRAPRLTLTYSQVTPTTATVACAADDFYLSESGWACPVSTRLSEYESAPWYSAIFGATQRLIGLSTPLQTLPLTSATMSACDEWGHCTSRASNVAAAPGGIATDLTLWLRANAGTSSTTPGGTIASWADQSSAGNTVAQANTTHQPTYQSNQLNGHPVVRFDTTDFLDRSVTGSALFNPAESTLLFVKKSVSGNVWFKWETATSNHVGMQLGTTVARFDFPNDSTGLLLGSGTITDAFHLITALKGAAAQWLYLDGAQDATRTNSGSLTTTGSAALTIGKNQTGTLNWIGDMAEVLIYRSALSPSARAKVESYLALKYGLTLAPAQPYVDSLGGMLWDGASNPFHHDVAGLARDDATGLAQYQSRSASSDGIVTLTVGNTPSSPAIPTEDRTYLLWGNDNGALATVEETDSHGVPYSRLARTWQVRETGDLGEVSVQFDLTGLSLPINASQLALLISGDGDFSDATLHLTGRSVSGSVVTFTNVDFSTGDRFTLRVAGPMPTVYLNVPEAGNYRLLYALDIPVDANYASSAPAYAVNNSATVGPFDRVAYYLELAPVSGTSQWAYASMDAFTDDASKLGVPTVSSGALWDRTVSNLNVASNVAGVTTGTGIATGSLEFWHHCYGSAANNGRGGSTYDTDDTIGGASCYGSMQVHNYGAAQTVLAWNRWAVGGTDDIGLGNRSTAHPDWTFANNTGSYTSRTLYVLVRETDSLAAAKSQPASSALPTAPLTPTLPITPEERPPLTPTLTVTVPLTPTLTPEATSTLTPTLAPADPAESKPTPTPDSGTQALLISLDAQVEATATLTPTVEATPSPTIAASPTLTPTLEATPDARPTATPTPMGIFAPATPPPDARPRPVQGDTTPPTGLELTLLAEGQPLPPNRTIEETPNPLLTVEWTPASDPGGIDRYEVRWYQHQGGLATAVLSATLPATATRHDFQAGEAQELTVQVSAVDSQGNRHTVDAGPVYVDFTSTPVLLGGGNAPYLGWLDNACNLLGTDLRVEDSLDKLATLERRQAFHAAWDGSGLRLAWAGADWRTQGNLFIYLDTRQGGSSLAYSPVPTSTSAIHLPLLQGQPGQPRTPMGADFLLWVADDASARLLAWDGAAEAWSESAAMVGYRFHADQPMPLTDLFLPFESLGITNPATQPLTMVALATEEASLDVWATMPPINNVSSDLIVPANAHGEVQSFLLSRAYRWGRLEAGTCPSGVDNRGTRWPGRVQFNGAHLSASLATESSGALYQLFRHHMIFAHHLLFGGEVDWGEIQDPLCQNLPPGTPPPPQCVRAPDDGRPNQGQLNAHTTLSRLFGVAHAPVTEGQSLHHTLEVVNHGTRRAQGVQVVVTTRYGMRLPGGAIVTPGGDRIYERIIDLGTMEAGERRTVPFEAIVDTSFNPERLDGYVRMRIVLFDETGGRDSAAEDIHLDRELDIEPPDIIELSQPVPLIGDGEQTLTGFVHDQSAVPTITLEVGGKQTVCPDATPTDNQWACTVNLGSRTDGTPLPVRLKARDIHGQESAWIVGPTLMVDTAAPTLTLSLTTTAALTDGVVGPSEAALTGSLTDERYAARVEVCEETEEAQACQAAEVTLDAATTPTLLYSYEDQPETPPTIGAANACEGGTPLVRTFSVPDGFTVADVDLGLTVEHPFRNDLRVTLTSPAGTSVEVVAKGAGAANLDVWLSDDAPASVRLEGDPEGHTLENPVFEAVRRPYGGNLSAFRGEGAQGTWQVALCDEYAEEDDGAYIRGHLALRPAEAPTGSVAGWTYRLPMPNNTEEERSLVLYGYDVAGNRSAPLPLDFLLDSRAPVLTPTVTTPTLADALGTPFRLAGTVTDATTVTLYLDLFTPDRRLLGDPILFDQATWHYSRTERFTEGGIYCLFVRAQDLPGNASIAGPFAVRLGYGPNDLFLPLLQQAAAPIAAVRAPTATSVYLPLVAQAAQRQPSRDLPLRFVEASACQ